MDIKHYLDWLFRDQSQRKGKYVIAEVPNLPLLVFMASIIIAVLIYPGVVQRTLVILAYIAFAWWSYLEARSGRSRFRKLLGYLGLLAVVVALVIRLGF